MLKLVIPKGSLEEQTLRLLEAADLAVRRGSNRDYHGSIDDERIERVSLLRPQEIPTYVQDAENGDVLMMGWMNRESVTLTIAEGRTVFWSRSRQELWRKGETSGHVQHVEEIRVDCDADVLLIRAHQVGAACHTGERSCFFRTLED